MKLHEKLKAVIESYSGELFLLRTFISEVDGIYSQRYDDADARNLSDEDFEELVNLMEEVKESGADGRVTVRLPDPKKATPAEAFIRSLVLPVKQRAAFAEMALVYLVALQEAFVKDYLKALFSSRKYLLKSKKKLSYEEIASASSMKGVIALIAQREVDLLSYGSIDDVAAYLEEKFNLHIAEDFAGWEAVREASYRRNIVIHNRGRTNTVYCKKTGYDGIGIDIETSTAYVLNVLDGLEEMIAFLHQAITAKIK